MATATYVQTRMENASGVTIFEVDYDDTSDPANWLLIELRVTNGQDQPCFLDIRRGNGASWWTVTMQPGEVLTRAAGGPVRRQSDIPESHLRTGVA